MTGSPILDTTYPVLIFKSGRGTIHHGAVAIARSLGRLGVPVYAIVEDGYTPLTASRYVTKYFIWNSWPRDREAFLIAMSKIGDIINHPTILIPLDDLSAICVAETQALSVGGFFSPSYPRIFRVSWPTKQTYIPCVKGSRCPARKV